MNTDTFSAAGNKTGRCGMKTEIFSRVCGYHRPVKNWNKGKQQEFKDRKVYLPEEKKEGIVS